MVDYSDRFLGNTYASDEPVRFTVTLSGRADRVSVDVPESLFVRAQTIGSAYGLDLLPTIDVYADTLLDKLQCVTLLAEVRFVAEAVNDALLDAYLTNISRAIEACVNCSGFAETLIEGP